MSNSLRKPFQHELEIDNSKTVDTVQYFAQDKQLLVQAIKDLERKIAFKSQQIQRDIDLLGNLQMKLTHFAESKNRNRR